MNPEPTTVPLMLSIREAAEIYRLPVHFVRTLVNEKKVYSVQAGSKKFYINANSLTAYLSGDNQEEGK